MTTEPHMAPPAFDLPAVLQSEGYGLRPETDADLPFLMMLFAGTREEELKPVPWTDEQKAAFCAQQFAAQRHHYYTRLDACRFLVLERNGMPIGRLYLQDLPQRLHVVDIILLPQIREQGLGTRLFQALHDCAEASGRSVGIMVERFNRAMRFYRRLGYAEIADHGVYVEMAWEPAVN